MLIAVIVLLFTGQTLANKLLKVDTLPQRLLVNGGFTLLAALCMLVYGVFNHEVFDIGTATLLLGLLFGVLFAATVLFYNMALSRGPLAYSAFYFSASMIVPAICGVLFFGEELTALKTIALVLFLVAFYLTNTAGAQKDQPKQKGWLLLCILSSVLNGCLAVTQKCQQTLTNGTQAMGLMLVGFLTATVCYFAVYFLQPKEAGLRPIKLFKANALPMPLLALCSMLGNVLLTAQAGQIDSAVLYPVVQGGLMLCITLASLFFFREKATKQGLVGLFVGLVAIVLISL